MSPYLYETKSSDRLPPLSLHCKDRGKDRGFHPRFEPFLTPPKISIPTTRRLISISYRPPVVHVVHCEGDPGGSAEDPPPDTP